MDGPNEPCVICGSTERSSNKNRACLACKRRRYYDNRDVILTRRRTRRAQNPEADRAACKAWREANLEVSRACARRIYQKSLEAYVERALVRRAQKVSTEVEPINRRIVWERDGGICRLCGLSADSARWDLDHLIPLSAGGSHTYTNTAVAHPRCNASKGAADPRTDERWAFLLAEPVAL